jgi:Flp pilus assembly protein TadG
MMSVWTKFRNALRAFRIARAGNVAITFAFATFPIIATVGYAVDYSRANSVKVAMQAALDSTALMISKEAVKDTPDQLQTNAKTYYLALFNRTDVKNITVNVTYDSANPTQVSISSSVDVPTTFLAAVGWDTMTVGNSSTVKWGSSRLRVALVLDNTGSMAQGGSQTQSSKIAALQTATKKLLTQLKNAAAVNGDVYVSIIPFVKDVNLGKSNYNSDWIYWGDWDADSSTASFGSCSISGYNTRDTCAQAGTCSISGATTQNRCGTCSNSNYSSKRNCTKNNATWSPATWAAATWTPDRSKWNGCVMDRGNSGGPDTVNNYDTNAVQPDLTKNASLYAAEQYDSCPQAAMGLSYDWTGMNTLVNDMLPAGNTNQAIGLQLGWTSLVGGGPFTAPAMDPNYTYNQVIILLTDGLNTQDRWYTSQSSIDDREKITCKNINDAGITLYTIQVNTDNEATSTLLQNCAGSPGKYPDSSKFFLLKSADAIVTTFDQIGTKLSNLYVAK